MKQLLLLVQPIHFVFVRQKETSPRKNLSSWCEAAFSFYCCQCFFLCLSNLSATCCWSAKWPLGSLWVLGKHSQLWIRAILISWCSGTVRKAAPTSSFCKTCFCGFLACSSSSFFSIWLFRVWSVIPKTHTFMSAVHLHCHSCWGNFTCPGVTEALGTSSYVANSTLVPELCIPTMHLSKTKSSCF